MITNIKTMTGLTGKKSCKKQKKNIPKKKQ